MLCEKRVLKKGGNILKNLKLVLLILCVIVFGVTSLYAAPERVTFYPAPGQSPKINSYKPNTPTVSIDVSARNPIGFQSLNSATTGPIIAADAPYDLFEPNNDLANAKRIPYNSTIAATIGDTADVDFFIQNFMASRIIEISLKNIPSSCDYDLYLCTLDGTIIARSETTGNSNELITGTIGASSDYLIAVIPFTGFNATAQYNLYSGDISPVAVSIPQINTDGRADFHYVYTDYYTIPTWAAKAKIVFDWQYYGRGPDEVGVYTDRQIYWNPNSEATPTTIISDSGHVDQPLTPGQNIRVEVYYDNDPEVTGLNNAVWTNGITISFAYAQPPAPPVLDPIGNKTVAEGELLQFTVNATDIDGDPLTYSASGLPEGATFDPATRVFSWTPDFNQAGTPSPQVTFNVTDGNGGADSETITITVTDTP